MAEGEPAAARQLEGQKLGGMTMGGCTHWVPQGGREQNSVRCEQGESVGWETCVGREGGGAGGKEGEEVKTPRGKAVGKECSYGMLPSASKFGIWAGGEERERDGATERMLWAEEVCGGGARSKDGSCPSTGSRGRSRPSSEVRLPCDPKAADL